MASYITWQVMTMKVRYYIALLLLLYLGFSWWDTSWRYRLPINVTCSKGETVKIEVNTSKLIEEGKLRADCGDFLATFEDVEILPRYVLFCNSGNTSIWIKCESEGRIYLYYGNPEANIENSIETFAYGEEFNYEAGSNPWKNITGIAYVDTLEGKSAYYCNGICLNNSFQLPLVIFTVFYLNSSESFSGPVVSFSSEFLSVTLNTSGDVSVKTNTTSTLLGKCQLKSWNYLEVHVNSTSLRVFCNGNFAGNFLYSSNGLVGIHANDSFTDVYFVYHQGKAVVGNEESVPSVVMITKGVEEGNMFTIFTFPESFEYLTFTIKTSEPPEKFEKAGNEFTTSWASFYVNESGYYVNSTFRRIDASNAFVKDESGRFSAFFQKNIGNARITHIVQIFKKYPLIKHVIFAYSTENEDLNYTFGNFGSCEYSWLAFTNTSSTFEATLYSLKCGNVTLCGINKLEGGNAKIEMNLAKNVSKKYVFYEIYGNYTCSDFFNRFYFKCKDLFGGDCIINQGLEESMQMRLNDFNFPLVRLSINSSAPLKCKLNGYEVYDGLNRSYFVQPSILIDGVNELSCSSSQDSKIYAITIEGFDPSQAQLFLGKREGAEVEITIPRVAYYEIAVPELLIPVTSSFKFTQENGFTYIQGFFTEGVARFFALFGRGSMSPTQPGGVMLPFKIKLFKTPVFRFFMVKALPKFEEPKTSRVSSASAVFYENSTAAIVKVRIWKS